MKKFFWLIAIAVLFNSCSVEEEPEFHYEILAVDSYIAPETFIFNESHAIKVFYKKPTTCHAFQGFYFDSSGNERTVAVQSIISHTDNCLPLEDNLQEATFYFTVKSYQTYLFKFYKGNDEEGNATYDIIEIPVTN